MLTITKPQSNRIDISLDGILTADLMREALDTLIDASADIRHGVMLYRIPELCMPTIGALAVEFARLPKLFGLVGKFDKCAVLSDAHWLRMAAEIEGRIFPGLDIKSFTFDEVDAAEAWLAEDVAAEMTP